MTVFDPETEIEALIETYAGGFDDYDAEAIIACFAYPSVIWQLDKGHVFAEPAEMGENVAALLKAYEEASITLSSFEITALTVAGETALAEVSWEQEDDEGVVVMDFVCSYHLILRDGTWKIAMIVNPTDEEDDEEDDD